MRALVTGAAGFIGSRLAARLVEQGASVVGVDCLSDYYPVALKRANIEAIPVSGPDGGSFRFVRGDLGELDLTELLAGVEVVFHLAGQPGVRVSWGENFGTYLRENVAASQRLLEAAMRAPDLRRLVFASSSSVYGNAERYPTTEREVPRPVSPYGVTKLAAEHLMGLYAANFAVPTVSLRYFSVYGPGQRPDMAFSRFLGAALENREITIFGDGNQVRDFTYVDDVVAATIAAATSDADPGSVYNVSGGGSVSVRDVLEMIAAAHGTVLKVRFDKEVSGDATRTGADTSALRALVPWHPTVELEEGIGRQLDWMKARFPVGPASEPAGA